MTTADAGAAVRPTITLWESAGSQMEPIALRLAEILEVPIYGQAVSSDDIARAFDGETSGAEDLTRLLQSLGPDSAMQAALSGAELSSLRDQISLNTRAVERHARGGGILLGRNGAYILRNWPNVLNVWLDGPEHQRVNRAAELAHLPSEMAAVRLKLEDDARVSMSVFSYGYDPRDLEYYDLVVNTCRLDVEHAARLIAAAAVALRRRLAP